MNSSSSVLNGNPFDIVPDSILTSPLDISTSSLTSLHESTSSRYAPTKTLTSPDQPSKNTNSNQLPVYLSGLLQLLNQLDLMWVISPLIIKPTIRRNRLVFP